MLPGFPVAHCGQEPGHDGSQPVGDGTERPAGAQTAVHELIEPAHADGDLVERGFARQAAHIASRPFGVEYEHLLGQLPAREDVEQEPAPSAVAEQPLQASLL